MAELVVPLRITPGIIGVHLRHVCGKDEISVEEVNTKTALSLLDGLITKGNGNNLIDNFTAAKIVTADRDRILASIYTSLYGAKVKSTLNCENCKEQFDLDFSLPDLLNHYQLKSNGRSEDGIYLDESGTSFRLPTGEDELMLADFSQTDAENFLMKRCILTGDAEIDMIRVQQKMSEIAPVLNIEMQADCPECRHQQQVQFDIQSFLLMKLKQERPRLISEIHSIALNYHWTQDVILDLPRSLRKQYVALIESEI